MANFKKHLTTGAFVGGGISLIHNLIKQHQKIVAGQQIAFDWQQLLGTALFGTAVGAIGGILPDVLEPAFSPHHRKTFHSLTIGLAMCKGMHALEKADMEPDTRTGLQCAGMGYLSHLLLDMNTPMGLPVI